MEIGRHDNRFRRRKSNLRSGTLLCSTSVHPTVVSIKRCMNIVTFTFEDAFFSPFVKTVGRIIILHIEMN